MQHPCISVVVPVYREQAAILPFLSHLREVFSGARHEIIVVDGSPAGETIAEVQDPDIQTLSSAAGRSRQMNCGAETAQGDILLFVHVDTRLPAGAPALIREALTSDKIVGGAFSLGISSRDPLLRLIAKVANLRSRWTRVPYGDQALFMRKECFERIGMFPEIPLMEDLELMHRVKKQGWKIVILQEKVATSARRWHQEGKIACTLRNWSIRLLYHCGVPAEKLAGYYTIANPPNESKYRR